MSIAQQLLNVPPASTITLMTLLVNLLVDIVLPIALYILPVFALAEIATSIITLALGSIAAAPRSSWVSVSNKTVLADILSFLKVILLVKLLTDGSEPTIRRSVFVWYLTYSISREIIVFALDLSSILHQKKPSTIYYMDPEEIEVAASLLH